MKISTDVVGLGFAHAETRIADIRRRAVERLEAERAAREARALASRSAEEMAARSAEKIAKTERGNR
ncbi:hypothetical protein [Hyphomicrobium sp.]|uniref:hypothetical protein n=1 Tax=Hyphomicrobium sp. TaxID=82 RepID=UPI003F71506C